MPMPSLIDARVHLANDPRESDYFRLDDTLYTPDDAMAQLRYWGFTPDAARDYLNSLPMVHPFIRSVGTED